MKRKIKYLIWCCSLAMLTLTTVQVYFIFNTYSLKKKEAETAVRTELISMEESINIDSIRNAWFKQGEALLQTKGLAEGAAFFRSGAPEISRNVTARIDQNRILHQYHTAYRVVFTQVTLKDPTGKMARLQNVPWFNNGNFRGQQLVIRELITDNDIGDGLIRNFDTRSSFSINDGENSILREMLGLLIFSVLLLAAVILLFYFSIRSLITQKKISDMQTDFINNITHEFNTPLATLSVALSTAKSRQPAADAICVNALNVIGRQHQRLKKLIDQVVSHTTGPDQLLLNREIINMSVFIGHLLDDFAFAHRETELLRNTAEATLITADPFYLTTALINILENAIRYGGTRLTVTTAVTNRTFQFSVLDNGIGIAPGNKSRIFEKFFRVEKGDIHTAKGLGLGLYYSRQIVEAHGGRLTVSSKVQQGSAFTISLPLT